MIRLQKYFDCFHGDLSRFLIWKMKFASGNTAKGNALQPSFRRQLQAGAIAGGERFAVALPQRAVEDVYKRQGLYRMSASAPTVLLSSDDIFG